MWVVCSIRFCGKWLYNKILILYVDEFYGCVYNLKKLLEIDRNVRK